MENRANNFIVIQGDIFIGYREKKYAQRRINNELLYDGGPVPPKACELSPYKLHISLLYKDYIAHQEAIKEILLQHFRQDAIHDFKFVMDDKLKEKITQYKAKLKELVKINKTLKEGIKIPSQAIYLYSEEVKNIIKQDNSHVNQLNAYKTIVSDEIENINDILKTTRRFINSDQFTIYIPADFDSEKIRALCNDIDRYLHEKNLTPGKQADVVSPLGNYISFRQEYLLNDFYLMNEGIFDLDKRIDSLQLRYDEQETLRRNEVKAEQDNSELYRYLSAHLAVTPEPTQKHSHGMFRNKLNADERKNQDTSKLQTYKKK